MGRRRTLGETGSAASAFSADTPAAHQDGAAASADQGAAASDPAANFAGNLSDYGARDAQGRFTGGDSTKPPEGEGRGE